MLEWGLTQKFLTYGPRLTREVSKGHQGDFPSVSGSFSKMYRVYRKILNSEEGDFGKKNVFFRRNFKAHFRNPPREGSHI